MRTKYLTKNLKNKMTLWIAMYQIKKKKKKKKKKRILKLHKLFEND
jgi:hypothetical protein